MSKSGGLTVSSIDSILGCRDLGHIQANLSLTSSRTNTLLPTLSVEPKPLLTGLKAINLSCATKNEHFGARHFIKEELPRIQYANPELKINVKMIENPPIRWGELWRSEMQLEFKNGISKKLEMTSKHSISILEELKSQSPRTHHLTICY
ncbi:hypothetical protein PNOK_0165800 [Pyrrhoderma noxium]|uniref:Uncharacterized protein n=1 Tax=Pyrrhoderma noxium TaxID=2282107 RepID=A0A286UQ27_9AGAM|nr:hypothetical protein PNOK_0165800 [Pyrrhoderma noxium]